MSFLIDYLKFVSAVSIFAAISYVMLILFGSKGYDKFGKPIIKNASKPLLENIVERVRKLYDLSV